MSWITIVWSMEAAACLTLAVIHLVIWARQRAAWANLLFAVVAVSVAGIAAFEFLMMRAPTPAGFGALVRSWHLPVFSGCVAIVGFIQVYLRTGRPWFAWSVVGLRTLVLAINFLEPTGINYREITALAHPTFLGETISVAQGVANPWSRVGELTNLWLVAFVADASIALWRRGDAEERRRAAVIGGSLALFVLVGLAHTILVRLEMIRSPYLVSFAFLPVLAAMAYELSRDLLRAAQLARDLRESEQRMALAADAANLGFWVRDLARNEIWATEKWRALFGFAKTERLDLDGFFQRLHPEDRESVRQALAQALAGDGDYEKEFRVVLPDGQLRWLASRGRVEFNGGGKPVLVRGVSADITHRKQTEMEIQLHREELAHLSRVTMLGELSGSLAHELNQPLAAILSNAQAAQRFLARDETDLTEVRAILADIVDEDKRAGEVIRRLRLLLRKNEVEHQPLDLNDVIQEVLKLVRNDLVNQGITTQVELAPVLPAVSGDRVQLQQVVLNIILNACHAMTNTPPADRVLIVRSSGGEGDEVRVEIADRGCGIPAENLDRLFTSFFTTRPEGMGLGLAVCRTIMDAHAGKMWAANNPERGATFHFTIPAPAEPHS